MAVTGLREEKGWRRVGEEEEVGGWGLVETVGALAWEKKNSHKKGKIETPSCYSSLTFSMSTWFARTLCEIALDECDFSVLYVILRFWGLVVGLFFPHQPLMAILLAFIAQMQSNPLTEVESSKIYRQGTKVLGTLVQQRLFAVMSPNPLAEASCGTDLD